MTTLKQLKETLIGADTISKKRDGTILMRRGYFYSSGMTAEKFACGIQDKLDEHFPNEFKVIDYGDVWKPFRGGASVAQSTHWWCTVEILTKS